ncbi:GEVED domain-containing protein [Chryseobacterium sp. MP_3.2]|uniref:GEVED domain-containing protein n=1 Tax=Chryseobacterium sp. MP_3.2 TaxID=3071712 RepID=UPI002E138DC6
MSQKAKQIPGGVVNVNVSVRNATGIVLSTTKAWVDWNKNDVFEQDLSEKVYDISLVGARSGNVIFGFVVPVGTPAGFYTIRIRSSATNSTFDSCSTIPNGETEDYSFEVVEECAVTITSVTAEKRCGAGSVLLSAVGSSGTISYQWYNSEFGPPIANQTGNTFTTSTLSIGSYTYYVAAFNGTCYSTFRTPVKVVVSPTPVIQFTQSVPEICGPINAVVIHSSSDREEVTLLEEHFENTLENPVLFENVSAGNTNADGVWQLRASPYIPTTPPYNVVKPAISSGYRGGNFANIITDVRQKTNIVNHLVVKNNLNSMGFTNIKLEFDLYYFSEEDLESKNSLKVQYSIDGGVNWVNLKTYISDFGIPSRFQNEILLLPAACEDRTALKFRFTAYALGSDGEWMADIVGLDNIRIYGNKEVPANFIWSGNTALYDSSCSGAPISGGSPSICIMPTENDNQTKTQFNITAAATLANGCNLSKTVNIANNNKVWDSVDNNWGTANWQPAVAVPDISKCVLIKQPVNILTGGHFEAKNVQVVAGGTLTIKNDASLKIQDALVNNAAAVDVLLESDGNLIQVNDGININTGAITAKKTLKISNPRKQYNYLMSPLEGQTLKTIYPGIDFVLYYNESNNYFYNSSGAYIKGRGLAVKEPNTSGIPAGTSTVTGTFTGKPTNGSFTYTMVNSAPGATGTGNTVRGYNLVGNPYPSNINLTQFYAINGGNAGTLSSTFYFWDSSVNDIYVQQGSNYGGQSYGQFNASTGVGIPANGDIGSVSLVQPTEFVKVGKAFLARSVSATTNLLFNNSIRTNATPPLNSRGVEVHVESGDHYWLSLVSPANIASTIAVAYFQGGNDALARDDSFSLMGSDALYSIVEDEKISINGKSPFTVDDVVSLGTVHFAAGNHRIMVKDQEGIFANGQNIYLKDRQTGILTNLSAETYTFTANAGESTGRFEIIYRPETVLITESTSAEQIMVYREATEVVIKSPKIIAEVEVYEASGKLWNQLQPNNKIARVDVSALPNAVYVLKIKTKEGEVVSRKFIR